MCDDNKQEPAPRKKGHQRDIHSDLPGPDNHILHDSNNNKVPDLDMDDSGHEPAIDSSAHDVSNAVNHIENAIYEHEPAIGHSPDHDVHQADFDHLEDTALIDTGHNDTNEQVDLEQAHPENPDTEAIGSDHNEAGMADSGQTMGWTDEDLEELHWMARLKDTACNGIH
ncbi:hypothetical protein F4604DRAFT_1677976 [Suillus subluteus]|nr:hypothetical protein F4604DRAFT_1677976 [Suillus subluteus]